MAASINVLAPITSNVRNPVMEHQTLPKSHFSVMLPVITNGRTRTENTKFEVVRLKTSLLLGVRRYERLNVNVKTKCFKISKTAVELKLKKIILIKLVNKYNSYLYNVTQTNEFPKNDNSATTINAADLRAISDIGVIDVLFIV